MSDPGTNAEDAPAPPTGEALDRARLRRIRRIAGVGALVGAALAMLAGLGGATGQAGAAIFLLVAATSCAVAATYGVLVSVRDDLRDEPVSRTRVLWVVGLFFGAAALMAMTAGAGG